jgi:paraquat-inducible protein B
MIDDKALPQATLVPPKRSRFSAVWLIPLVAAVVAIGIAVVQVLHEGPTITIEFNSAGGIEPGKTVVRYKDVTIGQVTAMVLSSDYSKVVVTVKMTKEAAGLMVTDAQFWVVSPRVTLSGVSGLSTLLSGNYIGFERGQSNQRQRRFVGLDTAPVMTSAVPGRQFLLKANDLGSLGIDSPVYFRRLEVGRVIAYDLAPDGSKMNIKVFVDAPYDRFVNPQTRFWNASGIDLSMSANGVEVHTESLVSLLIGGIAFDTPPYATGAAPADPGAAFNLYGDRATAMKQPDTIAHHYIAYTTESLKGLTVGAPVTLLGLPVGEVTDVGIDINPKTKQLRGRIELVAFPGKLRAHLEGRQRSLAEAIQANALEAHAFFQRLVEERGLRAQLRSGNLLTGQLYVAFDFFPDPAPAQIDWSKETPVLPMVPSTVTDLEGRITGILAKIEALPFKTIGADLRQVLVSFDKTLKDIDQAVNRIDTGLTPELTAAVADLRRAVAAADRLIESTNATLLGEDAPGQLQLRDALEEIAGAARSVRVLSDYLERQPESLIRGKTPK